MHRLPARPDLLVIDGISTICQRDQIPREILHCELRNTMALIGNVMQPTASGTGTLDVLISETLDDEEDFGHHIAPYTKAASIVLRVTRCDTETSRQCTLTVFQSRDGVAGPRVEFWQRYSTEHSNLSLAI